jgi:hypothetical protein
MKVTTTSGRDAVALVAATHTIVRSNEIVSRGDGWPVVVKAGSSDNKIAHNDASGILIGRPHDDVSSGNRVFFNLVQGGKGIYVRGGSATQTSVGTNRVIENGGDGILVRSASTLIANNRANRNAGHGINAVAGVTDLGRNRARGNLLSPQCINVVCN